MPRIFPSFVALLGISLLGQTPDPSIAVTVTRTVALPAEMAVLDVRVAAAPGMTAAQVAQTLASIGIREQHLAAVNASGSAVSNPQQFGGQRSDTIYSFQTTAPAEEFSGIITRLEALRRRLPDGVTRMEHNVYLSASQRSLDAARQAALPEMFTELRSRAENLAQIAGVRLGGVLSLIDSGTIGGGGGGPFLLGPNSLPGTRVNFALNGRFARQ